MPYGSLLSALSSSFVPSVLGYIGGGGAGGVTPCFMCLGCLVLVVDHASAEKACHENALRMVGTTEDGGGGGVYQVPPQK